METETNPNEKCFSPMLHGKNKSIRAENGPKKDPNEQYVEETFLSRAFGLPRQRCYEYKLNYGTIFFAVTVQKTILLFKVLYSLLNPYSNTKHLSSTWQSVAAVTKIDAKQ